MTMPYDYGPLYWTYAGMKARCYNRKHPRYADWGGRGIRVCERWLGRTTGFANFVADMGEKPGPEYQLDRRDNDGDYTPENCRWATPSKNSSNRRIRKTNKLGVAGIETRPNGTFVARITINKKRLNLGTFCNLADAVNARKKAEALYNIST